MAWKNKHRAGIMVIDGRVHTYEADGMVIALRDMANRLEALYTEYGEAKVFLVAIDEDSEWFIKMFDREEFEQHGRSQHQ